MGQADNQVKPITLLSLPDKSTLHAYPGDRQSSLTPLAPANRCTSFLLHVGGGGIKRERTKSLDSSQHWLCAPATTHAQPAAVRAN